VILCPELYSDRGVRVCGCMCQGTVYESQVVEGSLDLNRPASIGANLLCLGGFALVFALASVLGLKYLHRELR
jgi:hypothetical protein